MIWNLHWSDGSRAQHVEVDFAMHFLSARDYAAVTALPVGSRHVDTDGDTWERIE